MHNGMGVSKRWFWEAVRKDRLGFRFRHQHRIGPFFLDFDCAEARLFVEIYGDLYAERVDADASRGAHLAERGILNASHALARPV